MSVSFLGGVLFFLKTDELVIDEDVSVNQPVFVRSLSVVHVDPIEQNVKKVELEDFAPLTLSEIASLRDSPEVDVYYQRLVSEFMKETSYLEGTKDRHKIESRLKPIVQKFYYFNKNSEINNKKKLTQGFSLLIDELATRWTENPVLAQTGDDLFYELGMLDHEHVPYQFRKELIE